MESRAVEESNTNKLNPKQLRFCKEYVIDYNGAQAAIRSGYSENSAKVIAAQLLTKLNVKAEVERLEREKTEQLGITKERIMRELAYLAFSNMSDYMTVDGEGYPHLDFSNLTREQAAALTEVTVEEYVEAGGKDDEKASRVKKVKFKLSHKRAALVDLGKHIGMFRDRDEEANKAATDFHMQIMAGFMRLGAQMKKARENDF